MSFLTRLNIALVGPCGAGKSTLARALADQPGVDVVRELPPRQLETGRDYRDLDIALIQSGFLSTRLEQATAARSGIVIFDRTVDEDCNVFLRLHHELGGLNDHELEDLKKEAERIGREVGPPDVTVVLRAEKRVLLKRIGNGARPAWLVESFDRQLELYSIYIENIKGAVLEIDTTDLSDCQLQSVSKWIIETSRLAAARSRPQEGETLGLRWVWR